MVFLFWAAIVKFLIGLRCRSRIFYRSRNFGMSINSAQEQPTGAGWETSDEIDLKRYIGALWQRWPEILLTTVAVILLTAGAVWAYRQLTPPVYEATATAAIVRVSTDVRFDERFTTSSEEQNLDVNSRRTALIALVKSGSIAQQVIDELGDALPEDLRDPAALLETVHGEMATADGRSGQSDLINITVSTDSPEASAAIANAWASAYVRQVNSVYGQVPDEMLGSVSTELAAAQQTYQGAQAQLENHLAASQLDALVRQSNAISQTLNILQDSQLDAITGENDRNRSQLRMYYDQLLRTNSLLTAARALEAQTTGADAADAADAASTALALQVLQVQMVNAAAVAPPGWADPGLTLQQQPTVLQLQLNGGSTPTTAELRREIAATVASLEAQLAQLETSIAQATQALAAGGAQQVISSTLAATPASLVTDPITATGITATAGITAAGTELRAGTASLAGTIADLEEQERALQSRIEVETAARLEFTEQRNLAWESLQALNNKQAELQLARAAANSEVRLSSAAIPLDKPVQRVSLMFSVVLATAAGLLLGVLLALVLELMNVRPLRSVRRGA